MEKKLIYAQILLPLTAIDDFKKIGEENDLLRNLAEIVKKTNGIWSKEAKEFLFIHTKAIEQLQKSK